MRRRGFTLVEILCAISIIATLIAIAVPHWRLTTDQSRLSACKQNLHSYATALQLYSTVHGQRYPANLTDLTPGFLRVLATCPAAGFNSYATGYEVAADSTTYTLHCRGAHHASLNVPADLPYCTAEGDLTSSE